MVMCKKLHLWRQNLLPSCELIFFLLPLTLKLSRIVAVFALNKDMYKYNIHFFAARVALIVGVEWVVCWGWTVLDHWILLSCIKCCLLCENILNVYFPSIHISRSLVFLLFCLYMTCLVSLTKLILFLEDWQQQQKKINMRRNSLRQLPGTMYTVNRTISATITTDYWCAKNHTQQVQSAEVVQTSKYT